LGLAKKQSKNPQITQIDADLNSEFRIRNSELPPAHPAGETPAPQSVATSKLANLWRNRPGCRAVGLEG
jgi:hypothetical protein